jgi:hypothetical protein
MDIDLPINAEMRSGGAYMRSHITIPRSSLLRFAESDDKGQNVVSYYDKTEKTIKTVGANDNRRSGYYSSAFEKCLSDNVETVLGDINAKIVKFESDGEVFFNAALKAHIVKIIALQSIRTPDVYKQIMDKERMENFIDDNAKTLKERTGYNIPDDEILKFKDRYSTEKNQREIFYTEERATQVIQSWDKLLFDFFPNFSVIPNGSICSFTLTDSHCYSVGSIFYVPFSPRYALMLVPNAMKEQFYMTGVDGVRVTKYLTCTEERAIAIFEANMKDDKYNRLFGSRAFLDRLKEKKII